MATTLTKEEQEERDRIASHRALAAADRAREEARRKAQKENAKRQESLIVHGPARE